MAPGLVGAARKRDEKIPCCSFHLTSRGPNFDRPGELENPPNRPETQCGRKEIARNRNKKKKYRPIILFFLCAHRRSSRRMDGDDEGGRTGNKKKKKKKIGAFSAKVSQKKKKKKKKKKEEPSSFLFFFYGKKKGSGVWVGSPAKKDVGPGGVRGSACVLAVERSRDEIVRLLHSWAKRNEKKKKRKDTTRKRRIRTGGGKRGRRFPSSAWNNRIDEEQSIHRTYSPVWSNTFETGGPWCGIQKPGGKPELSPPPACGAQSAHQGIIGSRKIFSFAEESGNRKKKKTNLTIRNSMESWSGSGRPSAPSKKKRGIPGNESCACTSPFAPATEGEREAPPYFVYLAWGSSGAVFRKYAQTFFLGAFEKKKKKATGHGENIRRATLRTKKV